MRALLGTVSLVAGFFPFITLNMCCHTLLACRVSAGRLSVDLMGILLYVICCFSLAAFNICSLYLIFDSLINMCLGVCLLGFILYGTLLCFLDLGGYFFSHVRAVFDYNHFKCFLGYFLSLLLLGPL